jgi:uncharacterized protein YkwD
MSFFIHRSALIALFLALLPACVVAPSPLPAAPASWTEADFDSVTPADFRKDPRFLKRIDFNDIDYPLLDAAIFYATNEIRIKNGLKPLAHSAALEEAAAGHARRMAEKDFFSHSDPFDKTRAEPADRLRLAGVANPHPAENIVQAFGLAYAAGKPVYARGRGGFSYAENGPLIPPHTYLSFADAALAIWMNSSGHRANILSSNALELGCGTRYYANRSFNDMPMFTAVQNFQWFEKVRMKGGEE